MPRLDEVALRAPGFTPGVPIRLADGQEWSFPKPVVKLCPVLDDDGAVSIGGVPSFGPDYDDLVEAWYASHSLGPPDQIKAMFALGVDLLKRNYTLTPADLRRLLRFHGADAADQQTWEQIADVATGKSPKPSPAGGAPSSAPAGSPAP